MNIMKTILRIILFAAIALMPLAASADDDIATLRSQAEAGQKQQEEARKQNATAQQQNAEPATDDNAAKLKKALSSERYERAAALHELAENHYAPAYYHYAKSLYEGGNYDKAREYCKLSISAWQNVAASKMLLTHIDKKKETAETQPAAAEVDRQQQSSEPATDDNAAKLKKALSSGRYERAAALRELAENHYAPAYYHYAQSRYDAGDYNKAREYCNLSISAEQNVAASKMLLRDIDAKLEN